MSCLNSLSGLMLALALYLKDTGQVPFSLCAFSLLNTHECTRRRNVSGTLTTLGTIFNETSKEEPFISKLNEINWGSFAYFSWVCVFHSSPRISLK